MGVVYKARDEKLKRVVALKMVLGDTSAGMPELTRFYAEAEVVARLHHPNIVQIYEINEHNGRPYQALEYVQGGTLRTVLDGKPQPPRAAAQLVEMLARGVHAAHLHGIVHRDLKPSNILLSQPLSDGRGEEGGPSEVGNLYGVPKITDFGLAKRLDQDQGPTQSGEVLGTPVYMAPEQARARPEEVSPAVDTYALGAILYEMLTGLPPFQAEAITEVLNQVATEAPRPPRQLRQGLSRDLEAICLKCLAKNPRQRYASSQALADDLRRYLNGESIRARPAGPAKRLWRWCLRNPVAASLLLTVTLVLGFGLWLLSRLSDEIIHDRAEKDAHQETEMLLETMRCYSENVVKGARAAGLQPTHNFKGKEGGIPFPVAFTMELSAQFKRNDHIGMEVRVYSDYRFKFRGPPGIGHLDAWEKEALARLREDPEQPIKTFTAYRSIPTLRYATPLVMRADCVACHNDHPESTKTDWKEGDVRGVMEIIRPLAADMADTNEKLQGTYLFLGGTAVTLLALCGVVLAIGRRQRR